MRYVGFGVVVIGLALVAARSLPAQEEPIHHDAGQSVTPSFEGWYQNPDGTYSLSFGYMNRNYKEELDIPIGPNNKFEPGPADQGQPTHFLPRRQTGTFAVIVPKDFGDKKLTWTIVAHGQAISIPGHLRPEWQIDALKESTSGNTPPVIKFDPAGKSGQGPAGTTTSLKVALPDSATLNVWVADDGVKKAESERRRGGPPPLGVGWSKFRGPGKVTFASAKPPLDPKTGKATTTATFSAPGDYVLRVLAWDDSGPQGPVMAGGFQCCWTNGFVQVSVSAPQSR